MTVSILESDILGGDQEEGDSNAGELVETL